ncbi:DUF1857-domain-containing protein [Mycena filopes]|nr:DUF1857-domain-containing protein [Mycena filopes]
MAHAFAATRPVNPPGAEPVLTEAQLWKGLEYKLQNPLASTLLLDQCSPFMEQLVRELTLANSGIAIEEKAEAHTATIMYFEMSTGQRIANIISYGPDNELLLTYSFANGIPGVPADKPKPSPKELNAMLKKALERGLAIFREMVKEGKL